MTTDIKKQFATIQSKLKHLSLDVQEVALSFATIQSELKRLMFRKLH